MVLSMIVPAASPTDVGLDESAALRLGDLPASAAPGPDVAILSDGAAPAQPAAAPDVATGPQPDVAKHGLARWLDDKGSLLQSRPDETRFAWSKVPVGPEAALDLVAACEPREIQLLADLAARDYLTVDQITRVLYQAERTAQTHLYDLFAQRFVCRFDQTPSWMGRAVGVSQRPPGVYFLDWNGKYALEGLAAGSGNRSAQRLDWRPDRIAQPGATVAHQLGLNEVWSHLIAAARSTYPPAHTPVSGMTLMVGWQDEAGAVIRYGAAAHQVVRPDAEVRLRIGPPAPRLASLGGSDAAPADWAQARLESRFWPATPDELTAAVNAETPDGVRYRTILVEFESGAHHPAALIEKIKGYNTLFQRAQARALARFGRIPRIVVITRDAGQVDGMVALWRTHYFMAGLVTPGSGACPVLVSSLPALKAAQAGPGGVLGRCWVNALDPEAGTGAPCQVLTLGEALGVTGL